MPLFTYINPFLLISTPPFIQTTLELIIAANCRPIPLLTHINPPHIFAPCQLYLLLLTYLSTPPLIQATLELIIAANYRPIRLWERVFGKKVLHEGHEGIVGALSSLNVLYIFWPSQY